jgi:hypothetical protein
MSHHGEHIDYIEDESDITYYPSPVSRKAPAWSNFMLSDLGLETESRVSKRPTALIELFREIYQTLGGGQHRLAIMGIRAFFEQMMVTQVGDQGTFAGNLNAFYQKGYISLVQRDAMSAILDAGHAVTHRLYKPTASDLETALDIAEGIFAAIYVHPDDAARVADRVPPRKGKPAKNSKP